MVNKIFLLCLALGVCFGAFSKGEYLHCFFKSNHQVKHFCEEKNELFEKKKLGKSYYGEIQVDDVWTVVTTWGISEASQSKKSQVYFKLFANEEEFSKFNMMGFIGNKISFSAGASQINCEYNVNPCEKKEKTKKLFTKLKRKVLK